MKHFFLIITVLICFATVTAQQQNYSRAKIYLDAANHNMETLSKLGVAVDHGEYKANTFFISDFSETELKIIDGDGFKKEILINDVSKYYREQNNNKAAKTTSVSCDIPAPAIPAHFHLGTYSGGFFSYTEMLAIIDSMQLLYPGLISVKAPIDTFHSIEGRPIYWVRISNNPSVYQPLKPQGLFTALHHAREPGSISALIYTMWYMLENYATDPKIKAIIDNEELYFVPCVNPDGYLYNISMGSGGMWRKNRRHNSDGSYGIDLNRNYGLHWGYDTIGSSPTPAMETYRGTAPFSEPETQAIKWFADNHHFGINLNYHTFHNDILYPWGYIASFQTVDSDLFFSYGGFLTQYNHYRYGTCNQVLNYISNGDSNDWMYGDTLEKPKVYAFTPEVGTTTNGFYPPTSQILPDCQNNLMANINAAALLLPFARVSHPDKSILTQTTGYLHYNLKRLGLKDNDTFTVQINPLDSWMTVSPTPHVFTNVSLLQQISDSFSYTISSSAINGQLISYELQLYNGYYYVRDTVHFYLGRHYQIVTPSTSSLTGWAGTGWSVCTSTYYTTPASIKSSFSCSLPYPTAVDNTLTITTPVDLTHSLEAYLQFYSKWAIETDYDYVAVNASVFGSGIWTPLCGRYTKAQTTSGLPSYDGQQPVWVQEEMNLADYIGQKILIQYELYSDLYTVFDGFYFDDISITAVQDSTTLVQNNQTHTPSVSIYPNPAKDEIILSISGYSFATSLTAILYNYLGRAIMEIKVDKPSTVISVKNLPDNIYFLKTVGDNIQLPVQKIEVLR